MQRELLNFLEENTWSRERRNKDDALVEFLQRKYRLDVPRNVLKEFVRDYNACDRYWRGHLQKRKDLRGKDYNTKQVYEKLKQREMGYKVYQLQEQVLF